MFALQPGTVAMIVAITMAVGIAAAIAPTVRAARIEMTQGLRHVG